ncbi:MAG: response regulator transcription factor [Acidimicrobiales bacterium]
MATAREASARAREWVRVRAAREWARAMAVGAASIAQMAGGVPSILVVDDDPKIRDLVSSYLAAEGYEVAGASDGAQAIQRVRALEPDLVVMDVVMPGIDGIEALRQVRTFSDVYVIMLTARSEETDKLIGLSVGADDYLTKPFSPRELVARVKAVLRRTRSSAAASGAEETLVFPSLTIDTSRRDVEVDGEPAELTTLEFDLLKAMALQPRRVFSRRQLLEAVWGWDFVGDDRVVDVHIRNLRKALGDSATEPRFIGTVRGVGYRFELEPS